MMRLKVYLLTGDKHKNWARWLAHRLHMEYEQGHEADFDYPGPDIARFSKTFYASNSRDIAVKALCDAIKQSHLFFYLESGEFQDEFKNRIIKFALRQECLVYYASGNELTLIESITDIPDRPEIASESIIDKLAHTIQWIETEESRILRDRGENNMNPDSTKHNPSTNNNSNATLLDSRRRARLFGSILSDYMDEAGVTKQELANKLWFDLDMVETLLAGDFPIDTLDKKMVEQMSDLVEQSGKVLWALVDPLVQPVSLSELWKHNKDTGFIEQD